MSTTNPPKSSGSSLEQAGRKQQNLPLLVAVFLLLHAVVLGGILWVGCKPHKEDMAKNEAPPPSPIGGLEPIGGTNSPFFPPLDNSQSPAAPGPTVPSPPPMGPIGPPPGPSTGITSTPIPPPGGAPEPVNPGGPTTASTGQGAEAVMPAPAPPPPPPPGTASVVTPPAPASTTTAMGPTPAPTTSARTHVVGRGDTYYSIAREYKTTMNAIKEVNPGVDPTKLQLGQKINVPAPAASATARPRPTGSTHVVKSGDTLGRIARKHKTTVDRLRAVNGLTSDRILVGQVLRLPSN